MALRERYINEGGTGSLVAEEAVYGNQNFQELKARLHRSIITKLDLTKLNTLAPERVRTEVSRMVEDLLIQEGVALSIVERDGLASEDPHERFRLAPLEPLRADRTIS